MASNKVYVHVQKRIQTMVISSDDSVADVYNLFASAALINAESTSLVLKLYDQDGNLIPIGPNIQPNTPETAYRLKIKLPSNKVLAESEGIELVNEINSLSERISDLQTEILNNKISNNAVLGPGITSSPAITRVNDILQKVDIQEAHKLAKTGFTFTPQVLTELKQTNFDVWAYDDIQMIGLFHEMFKEFNLMETFNILEVDLYYFLLVVSRIYNSNPFHNFRHSFCVTQMVFKNNIDVLHTT